MANLTQNSTNELREGSHNLYFTKPRVQQALGELSTDSLPEGSTNLYFSANEFNRLLTNASGTGLIFANGNVLWGPRL